VKNRLKRVLARLGLLDVAFTARDYVRSVKFLKINFRYYKNGADDGLPIPPLPLIALVTGKPDVSLFFETGRLSASSISTTLLKNGLQLEHFHNILDFGCGSGRVMRHWKDLKNTTIHGVDYNRRLIQWCRENLRFAHFETNALHPPLPYQKDTFDFIYVLSVFTHLTEELQNPWMAELSRILRPGGYLLITTHGDYYLPQLDESQRNKFLSGELVIKNDGPIGSNLLGAYHPREYVSRNLSKGFEIVDFIPQGAKGNPFQDLYLFKKSS
jgi:SAM-dependent methyltransferase